MYLPGIDAQTGSFVQQLSEQHGVFMIFSQSLDVRGRQRLDSRGAQPSCLAHTAAEHLAEALRLLDELAGAAQHRADRRPKPLRETDHHRIDVLGNFCGTDSEVNGRVE